MRKWAKHCCKTLKFLTFCHKTLKYGTFCREMIKYCTFCRKCRKNVNIRAMRKWFWIKSGCEEAPQVVPACQLVQVHTRQKTDTPEIPKLIQVHIHPRHQSFGYIRLGHKTSSQWRERKGCPIALEAHYCICTELYIHACVAW